MKRHKIEEIRLDDILSIGRCGGIAMYPFAVLYTGIHPTVAISSLFAFSLETRNI